MTDRKVRIRRAVSRTRLASLAAFPLRLAKVARHDAKVVRTSAKWLFTSREHHNYTYELTPRNREHMAWFVSAVCDVPVADVRGWFDELDADRALRTHIEAATARAARRGLADSTPRYARRLGRYAMIRALRPQHVVEPGVDKGLGTCVIAAALLRNGSGRVTSLDINPEAGYLAAGEPWSRVVDLVIGDSLGSIAALDGRSTCSCTTATTTPSTSGASSWRSSRTWRPGRCCSPTTSPRPTCSCAMPRPRAAASSPSASSPCATGTPATA
jgi:hypothetical protein